MNRDSRKINDLIWAVQNKGNKVKAGIWQATETFKDEEMYVIRNVELNLNIPKHKGALQEECKPDLPWAEDHFQERISGIPSNPGETYKYWPYNVFKEDNDPYKDGKKFSHTYQERIWPKKANGGDKTLSHSWPKEGIRYEYGDLNDVIKHLRSNPLTRQAFLPIWFPEDTGATHNQRVPCTIGYYFWIHDHRLHCNYIIRSCDVLRHFRNDIYLTGRLLQYVADKLYKNVGELTMYIFNLHLFVNDTYALKKRENGLWKE